MGVHGLWNILGELAERKPLKYLSGKKVAVDLSGWVIQAMCCKGLNTSKNPHLKNLFFRVSRLLKDGALPIFIMEGDLPDIKKNAFKTRNQHHTGKYTKNDEKISRTAFNRVLSQCQELLKSLGVPCIKSSGEAEAFCAFLCANGVVEGVITEDNDAFLYGADSVYREFTIDRNDSHINFYSLKSKKNKLQLDRTKLVALALLLGSDYSKGVPGVGKDTVIKLLYELPDCDLLQRFQEWKAKSESELFPGYEANIKKSTHCSRCDHLGTQASHKKTGCDKCGSQITCYLPNKENPCLCSWHKSTEISVKRKAELKIYIASKKVANFPESKVIDEYLGFSDIIPNKSSLEWNCPDMQQFQEKAESYWGWTADNSFKKCLPIITSWHQHKITTKESMNSEITLKPKRIIKQTTVKYEDCLTVEWININDSDTEKELDCVEHMCTTEYLERFSKAYPNITDDFFKLIKQKKSKTKSLSKKSKIKASNPSGRCKKITEFYGSKQLMTKEDSKEINILPVSEVSLKRDMEEKLGSEEFCAKKQCIQLVA